MLDYALWSVGIIAVCCFTYAFLSWYLSRPSKHAERLSLAGRNCRAARGLCPGHLYRSRNARRTDRRDQAPIMWVPIGPDSLVPLAGACSTTTS